MKIIISNDHAGTVLKNGIIDYLNQNNHEVINIGTNNLDSVDYPDFAYNVAKSFKKEVIDFWYFNLWFWDWNKYSCKPL